MNVILIQRALYYFDVPHLLESVHLIRVEIDVAAQNHHTTE
jgi:hypothetical protein